MPKDNEVDEKVIWSDDLAAVLEAASEASAVPLTWFANREFSPEQTKAWLCDTVDNTVADGAFSGELHGIAEEESGLTVAFTGCGPKSAANAKFLIWCAHFILKHRDSLSDHAATVAELRAEVESSKLQGELSALEQFLRMASEPVGQECCGQGSYECCGNPIPVFAQPNEVFQAMSDRHAEILASMATLTGADPT